MARPEAGQRATKSSARCTFVSRPYAPEGRPIERLDDDGSPARALWGVVGVLAGLAGVAGLVVWRRKVVSRRG